MRSRGSPLDSFCRCADGRDRRWRRSGSYGVDPGVLHDGGHDCAHGPSDGAGHSGGTEPNIVPS